MLVTRILYPLLALQNCVLQAVITRTFSCLERTVDCIKTAYLVKEAVKLQLLTLFTFDTVSFSCPDCNI